VKPETELDLARRIRPVAVCASDGAKNRSQCGAVTVELEAWTAAAGDCAVRCRDIRRCDKRSCAVDPGSILRLRW